MLVSFDFDGTLVGYEDAVGRGAWRPLVRNIVKMKRHAREGHRTIVVTRRSKWMDHLSDPGVLEFVRRYNLPVDVIYFTEGDYKGPLLARLRVDLHYDDDPDEIESAHRYGVVAKLL